MNIERVYKPVRKEEVLDLLNKHRPHGKIIAGGTDIIIGLRDNKYQAKVLVDISHLEELKGIKETGDFIEIGGATSFTEIVNSNLFLEGLIGLNKSAREVGSPQIRNKGTVGGNIANGSSAADIVPPLMALGSMVYMENINGVRKTSLEEYYYNPIREDELLTKIVFKKAEDNEVLSFSKLGLRKALAISRLTLSSFASFGENDVLENIRVASGALARYPMREKEVEDFLIGKELNEKTILEAIAILKDSMDERLKGRPTLPYKRIAISTILKESLEDCLSFRKRGEASGGY